MNTLGNQYIKKLEKQNEQLLKRCSRAEILEEKFDYFYKYIDSWLVDINKKIIEVHTDDKNRDLETFYEIERKHLLKLRADLKLLDNEDN